MEGSGIVAVDRLVDRIAARPEVERVWLFGSRARGDARERSDVDLAVEAPGASSRDWIEVWELAEDAETLLHVDLVRVDTASKELQDEIRRSGRVLYDG